MKKIEAVVIIKLFLMVVSCSAQVTVSWDVNKTDEFKNGDTMELICTVTGTCCSSTRRWNGGLSFSSLVTNGISVNSTKYNETIHSNSFSLLIYKMERSDFLYKYRCTYEFTDSTTGLLSPPINARYVPASSEIQTLSSSTDGDKLSFEVNVTTVFPEPSCTATFGNANLTSNMTVTSADNFPFKFAVISMANVAYSCPGSLDVSCSVGSYSFDVLKLEPCTVAEAESQTEDILTYIKIVIEMFDCNEAAKCRHKVPGIKFIYVIRGKVVYGLHIFVVAAVCRLSSMILTFIPLAIEYYYDCYQNYTTAAIMALLSVPLLGVGVFLLVKTRCCQRDSLNEDLECSRDSLNEDEECTNTGSTFLLITFIVIPIAWLVMPVLLHVFNKVKHLSNRKLLCGRDVYGVKILNFAAVLQLLAILSAVVVLLICERQQYACIIPFVLMSPVLCVGLYISCVRIWGGCNSKVKEDLSDSKEDSKIRYPILIFIAVLLPIAWIILLFLMLENFKVTTSIAQKYFSSNRYVFNGRVIYGIQIIIVATFIQLLVTIPVLGFLLIYQILDNYLILYLAMILISSFFCCVMFLLFVAFYWESTATELWEDESITSNQRNRGTCILVIVAILPIAWLMLILLLICFIYSSKTDHKQHTDTSNNEPKQQTDSSEQEINQQADSKGSCHDFVPFVNDGMNPSKEEKETPTNKGNKKGSKKRNRKQNQDCSMNENPQKIEGEENYTRSEPGIPVKID